MSLRFKRHYKLFLALALVAALLILGAGDSRVVAYTVEDETVVMQAVHYSSNLTLVYGTVVHGLQVLASNAGM